jgi:hypothetical protein
MKVELKENDSFRINFSALKIGDLFLHNNDICLKLGYLEIKEGPGKLIEGHNYFNITQNKLGYCWSVVEELKQINTLEVRKINGN